MITDVSFSAVDERPLRGELRTPDDDGAPVPGVVLVPGSRHARDAWTSTASTLSGRGFVALSIDIRGRGTSRGETTFARMSPRERRRVAWDVAAAIEWARAQRTVDAERIVVVAEQDVCASSVEAATVAGVAAVVLLSARHERRLVRALEPAPLPLLGLVSAEDREGVRATVGAYLASTPTVSALHVFHGLGLGITMAAVRAFEHPGERSIEAIIADWIGERTA